MIYEALHDFPAKTLSIEYDNLAALRALPNFADLRKRYLGQPLHDLQVAFASAGIAEDQIHEIAIGSPVPNAGASNTYGVFFGRFNIAPKDMVKAQIGQASVYCLSTEKGGLCFMQLDRAIGAFGTYGRLKSLLDVRQGIAPGIASNQTFAGLLASTQASAPLRGVSDGSQIGNYVKEIVPTQAKDLVDWPKLFSSVSAFAYDIKLDSKAHLGLQLECKSETAASALSQLLHVMGSLQSATGGSQIRNFEVESSGTRVTLKLDSEIPAG